MIEVAPSPVLTGDITAEGDAGIRKIVDLLIIQIPCFNEEETLPATLADLPRSLPGVRRVEWQVIDDGCTDRTVEVAVANGVDHVVSLGHNRGLAEAFMAGIRHALRRGADIIVNTDADNQYCGADIGILIAPILNGKAEFVVGARPIWRNENFSTIKKLLQHVGSSVVRSVSGSDVADAPSGFRAFSRAAAKRLHVYGKYSYTMETLIQAGQQNLKVVSVPIRVNRDTRPSRLARSMPSYIMRSGSTIVRSYVTYRPMRTFMIVSLIFAVPGILLFLRFAWYYLNGDGQGHMQSLQTGSALISVAAMLFGTGILADLVAVNRHLLERIHLELQDLADSHKEPKDG